MSTTKFWPVLLCLTLVIAACTAERDTPSAETRDTGNDSLVSVEPTKMDTVFIEGMPEVMQLSLYEAPRDVPLAFSTYFPDDMIARDSLENAGFVAFLANFGGQIIENARMEFRVFPRGTDLQTAYAEARQEAEESGSVTQTTPAVSSAITQFSFSGNDPTGYILVGEHQERLYSILVTYPVEYGDGFAPRVDAIYQNWRWSDTGSKLVE